MNLRTLQTPTKLLNPIDKCSISQKSLFSCRSWGCEPVRWGVRQRTPPSGSDTSANCGPSPSRSEALWYCKAAQSVTWMCQQNTCKVITFNFHVQFFIFYTHTSVSNIKRSLNSNLCIASIFPAFMNHIDGCCKVDFKNQVLFDD